ncbi:hypothetical protein JYU34_010772 [Plutella xylostella]|uniref:Uncharacterized protein n=1 Tax=Plutella xylostella TaxID=51655 RepID=A0ABQ7QGF7_PLUXY|nr:hypothetical protein JYU34_010772 [Plutella xylostella]
MHKLKNSARTLGRCGPASLRCSMLRPSCPGDFPLTIPLITRETSLAVNKVGILSSLGSASITRCSQDRGDFTLKFCWNKLATSVGSLNPPTLTGRLDRIFNLFVNFQNLPNCFSV